MVRSPFTSNVLTFVGSVGTVNNYFDLKNSILKFRESDTWYYTKVVLTLLIGAVAVFGIMLGDPNFSG